MTSEEDIYVRKNRYCWRWIMQMRGGNGVWTGGGCCKEENHFLTTQGRSYVVNSLSLFSIPVIQIFTVW